jgi:DNA-binding NarL/FixJ family response regulator
MGEPRELRVLILDAQPVMRDGLAANLAAEGIEVIAETGAPEAAVEAAARHRPGVVLLDLSLVERHGHALIRRLRASSGGARIVVLSSLEDEGTVGGALRAGAERHLRKDAFREELLAAVRGEPPARGGSLSAREIEVLQLVARGRGDAEIGSLLGVAESTVKAHVASILRKTGTRGRTQAAIRALKQGDIRF